MTSASDKPLVTASREWLETDGRGGFASGTATGIRTRRYHALLLTAATPPTGRIVLVNGFEAWIETPRGRFALSSQRYAPDVIHPDGAKRIVGFADEPWPTWRFKFEDGTELTQELFLARESAVTALNWRVTGDAQGIRLFHVQLVEDVVLRSDRLQPGRWRGGGAQDRDRALRAFEAALLVFLPAPTGARVVAAGRGHGRGAGVVERTSIAEEVSRLPGRPGQPAGAAGSGGSDQMMIRSPSKPRKL